ncbi:MAG: MipA/OmpV family protein [Gammaproteobacteria bacterium]|nr:MipA/OmpV family protein [Gammaproteobacteria bacterium]
MRSILRIAATVLVASVFTQSALADEIMPPTDDTRPLTIGLLGGYLDKPIEGIDDSDKVVVAPLIIYEGKKFFFRATTFGWKFIDREELEFAVVAEGRFAESWDSSDSNALTGMSDRDPSLDGGFALTLREGNFGGKFTAVGDLTDEHSGFEVRAEGFYQTRMGKWLPRFSAAVIYQSENLVEHYYGVETNEAIPLVRPAYSPDATVNFRLQAVTAYALRPKWTAIVGTRYDFLGDEIDDSPITDDNGRFMFVAGIGYTFRK